MYSQIYNILLQDSDSTARERVPHSGVDRALALRFVSFLFGGFITAIKVNPPERKLAIHTSVQWFDPGAGNLKSC